MEGKKRILIILFILGAFVRVSAGHRSDIYRAYISNDMTRWGKVVDEMTLEKSGDHAFLLELLNYKYGYIAWCIGNGEKKKAQKLLEQADEIIAVLEKANYQLSWINGYKSAFFGYKIGLNPLRAPFWGPKSLDCAQTAVRLDPNNYFGYVQLGNAEFYMPAAFGGSKKVALDYFLKAEKLIEADRESLKENWNYLSLLAMIGQALTETGNYDKAKAAYDKALNLEPGFLYVKNELYPQLLEKRNKAKP